MSFYMDKGAFGYKSPIEIRFSDKVEPSSFEEHGKPIIIKNDKRDKKDKTKDAPVRAGRNVSTSL